MIFHQSRYVWFCICILIIGCKTPKVLPPPNLLRANHFDTCLQILREGLHSDEFWSSIYSAEALIDAGYGFEVTPILEEKLKKENEEVHKAAIAKALIKGGRQDGIVVLQNIMLGNNEAGQLESLKGLFYEVSVADTAIVGNLIRTSQNKELTLYALALLHITEKQKNVDEVRQELANQDPAIRIAASDILSFIGSAEQDTTQLVSNLSNARSELERFHTLRALALLDHPLSRETIPQLAKNTDPSIRALATYAIAESWLVEQVTLLYPLLEDPSLSVRVRAAQALLTLNDADSIYRYLRIR